MSAFQTLAHSYHLPPPSATSWLYIGIFLFYTFSSYIPSSVYWKEKCRFDTTDGNTAPRIFLIVRKINEIITPVLCMKNCETRTRLQFERNHGNSGWVSRTETPFHQQSAPLDVLTLVQSGILRYLFINLANRLRSVWKERLLVRQVKIQSWKNNKGDGLAGKLVHKYNCLLSFLKISAQQGYIASSHLNLINIYI